MGLTSSQPLDVEQEVVMVEAPPTPLPPPSHYQHDMFQIIMMIVEATKAKKNYGKDLKDLHSDIPTIQIMGELKLALKVYETMKVSMSDYSQYFLKQEIEYHYRMKLQKRLLDINQMLQPKRLHMLSDVGPDSEEGLLDEKYILTHLPDMKIRESPYNTSCSSFLATLLMAGYSRCSYPPQMTAAQRDDPYVQFAILRDFYIRYMINKELPHRTGCFSPKLRIRLQVDFNRKGGAVTEAALVVDMKKLDTVLRKQLKKRCRFLVNLVNVKYTGLQDGHNTVLIFDLHDKIIEYFDPNMESAVELEAIADGLMESTVVREWANGDVRAPVFSTFNFCPMVAGLQEGPFCAHYSILYMWLRLNCPNASSPELLAEFMWYTPAERGVIVKAFTCHMWNAMASIGLLGKGKGQLIPTVDEVNDDSNFDIEDVNRRILLARKLVQ